MVGGVITSAVTTELIPRLDNAPRMRPQEKAKYFIEIKRYQMLVNEKKQRMTLTLTTTLAYCWDSEILTTNRNWLSISTYIPWWLVRKVSACFPNMAHQNSLQTNLIMSSSSLNRFHSLVYLNAYYIVVINVVDKMKYSLFNKPKTNIESYIFLSAYIIGLINGQIAISYCQ